MKYFFFTPQGRVYRVDRACPVLLGTCPAPIAPRTVWDWLRERGQVTGDWEPLTPTYRIFKID